MHWCPGVTVMIFAGGVAGLAACDTGAEGLLCVLRGEARCCEAPLPSSHGAVMDTLMRVSVRGARECATHALISADATHARPHVRFTCPRHLPRLGCPDLLNASKSAHTW